jgi:hypothetical protein
LGSVIFARAYNTAGEACYLQDGVASPIDEPVTSGEAPEDQAPDRQAHDRQAPQGTGEPSTERRTPPRSVRALLVRGLELVELLIVVLASVALGLNFGLNYGVNNQVVYLLPSLPLLDGTLFHNDWFATGTTHYHPAFKYLGAVLIALNREGWGVALGLVAVVTAGMVSLYALIRTLGDRRYALASFLLLVAFAFATQMRGPAGSYVFDMILQPSTLAGAALFGALPFFVRERWLASGACLAVSGLFHINYLLLLCGAFAVAQLLLGPRDLVRRLIRQFALPLVVLLLFLPLILKSAGSPDAAEAQRIQFEFRSPHHFLVGPHESEFLPFVGWSLIGVAAAWPLARGAGGRPMLRLLAFLGGISIVIWLGVVLSLAKIGAVTQLFAWRLVPHAELVLELVSALALCRVIAEPGLLRRYGLQAMALVSTGAGLLLMYYANRRQTDVPELIWAALITVLVVTLARAALRRWAPAALLDRLSGPWWPRVVAGLLIAGAALLLYTVSDKPLRSWEQHSTLIRGLNPPEVELCAWMRSQTPKDAIFLTPPDIETIRFHGQRAIVVDWKSNPGVPSEVLEWYRRLEDVSGRTPLRTAGDLRGYDSLDSERLGRLRSRYHLDYAVVRRGRERALPGLRTMFRNAGYTVLELGAQG